MIKKKRTKKNNHQKRLDNMAGTICRGLAVVFCGGNNGQSYCANLNNARVYTPGLELARTIECARFNWGIICAVFCRDQNGKEYYKCEDVFCPDMRTQADLAPTVEQIHAQLIKGTNQSHICNYGWLALPIGSDMDQLDNAKIADIFNNAGAWNVSAKWEFAA